MATVLFTGLGNYNFKEKNTYIYKDQVYQKYFPYEVAQEVMKPDKIFIISTQDSWNKIYEMKDQYPDYDFDDPRIKHIHFGTNDDFTLTWKLYGDIQSVLKPGDEVIIDSTLGIRSAQFVLMSIINYLLQAQNNLVLKDVFYAGIKHDNETIDYISIKEFLVLNEWSNAINTYFTTGSTANIESLVSSGKGTPEEIRFVNQLTEFTNDLNTIRLPELKNSYEKIQKAFEDFKYRYKDDHSQIGPILDTIDDKISKELSRFESDPETAAIDWLLAHNQIVQAATLITELFYDFVQNQLLHWNRSRRANFQDERNIIKEIFKYEDYYKSQYFLNNKSIYSHAIPFDVQLNMLEEEISHLQGKEHYDLDDYKPFCKIKDAFVNKETKGLNETEKAVYDYVNSLDIRKFNVPKCHKQKLGKEDSKTDKNGYVKVLSHTSQIFLLSYMKLFIEIRLKTHKNEGRSLNYFKDALFLIEELPCENKSLRVASGEYYALIKSEDMKPIATVDNPVLLSKMIPLFNEIRALRNEIDHAGKLTNSCVQSAVILSQENKDKIDQLLLLIKQGKKELE